MVKGFFVLRRRRQFPLDYARGDNDYARGDNDSARGGQRLHMLMAPY